MSAINRRKFLSQSSSTASAALVFGTISHLFPLDLYAKGSKPLKLKLRKRNETSDGQFSIQEETVRWNSTETALIICDMWDQHWCQGATSRVGELAPRMNKLIKAARKEGVFIIHAPSSCMDAYKDHPARKRAQEAPKASTLPRDIQNWCNKIPSEERGKYPIDQADGGCDCEPKCKQGSPWRRQVAALEITNEDAISDSGVEVWNLLDQRGIKNVMVMGVHTNMCVLGRPFGLRQMVQNGKNTVLVRDMTDTMYNSKSWPYVSHFKGTDLIVEHIEKYVCPSITSASILGGRPFRFRCDKQNT